MTDWTGLTAAAQGAAVGEGRVDPRDLAEAHLERMNTHPDAGLIFARTTPGRARAEAAAAAERARSGTRAHPLDGVPVTWKDNVDMAGQATEAGSRLLAGRVPEADAPVLAAGTRAGLVCLGKTHLSELAFSGLGLNPMTATPPNVHDRRRVPGGSSAGAAVATALGMGAAAVGTDTGGSVRVPAAWNNLVGLKTTAGLVPIEGVVPLAPSLDTVGPLARTVEDAALMLSALTGGRAEVPAPALPDRLCVPETVALDALDAEVAGSFDAALSRLSAAGVAVSRTPVPEFTDTLQVMTDHGGLFSEAWSLWGETIEGSPDTMFGPIEARFRGNARFTANDEATSRERLAALGRAAAGRIAEGGILALPSVPILAPLIARLLADDAYYADRNMPTLRNTRLANLLGLCSITLPLPEPMCGLMLFAAPHEEDRLIAAGRAMEPVLAG